MNPDNTIYYNVISVWEVLLKHTQHADNMDLTPELFSESCKEAGFIPFELKDRYVLTVRSFPPVVDGHKDPFDRLLLAQAKTENLNFLTNDRKITLYQKKMLFHNNRKIIL